MAYDYSRFVRKATDGTYTAGDIFDQDGSFVRTRFKSDNGFVIAVFEPTDKSYPEIACKGTVPGYQEGSPYHLVGKVINDKKWGMQVNIATAEPRKPTNREEVIAFLGSGAIKGIGKATAAAIYDHFGEATDDIIENDPDRLVEIRGISKKKCEVIKGQLEEIMVNREVIGFLAQYGISQTVINTLIRAYGRETKRIVSENPYLIIRVKGFAFTRADAIAQKMGIAMDDPRRLYAGVVATLRYASNLEGHTLLPRENLVNMAREKLNVWDPAKVEDALDQLIEDKKLIEDEHGIHIKRLYYSEQEIKKAIRKSMHDKYLVSPQTIEKNIAAFEQRKRLILTGEQKQAIVHAFASNLSVVTGSAGCGKTFLVRTLVQVAHSTGVDVCLMSPTGRAAKHLSQVCDDEPAFTVHRALALAMRQAKDDDFFDDGEAVQLRNKGMSDASQTFKKAQIVLIDEASMIDTDMAATLMKSSRGKHIVLVGDYQQLPSVGPGQVLRDIIDSGVCRVTRLTQIFRQAEGSPIIEAANLVLAGKTPCYVRGVRFFQAENEDVQRVMAEKVLPLIADDMKTRDVMFLSPMRKTPVSGVNALNEFLRPIMNRYYQEPENPKQKFLLQRGDIVMQTRNNYEIDAFNGDLGVVEMIGPEGEVYVSFDGTGDDELVEYDKSEALTQLSLAYASTIHKSQGGQAKTVVGILTNSHFIMASRNILYTMITRAEDRLILVGSPKTFAMAANNGKQTLRMTGLRDF